MHTNTHMHIHARTALSVWSETLVGLQDEQTSEQNIRTRSADNQYVVVLGDFIVFVEMVRRTTARGFIYTSKKASNKKKHTKLQRLTEFRRTWTESNQTKRSENVRFFTTLRHTNKISPWEFYHFPIKIRLICWFEWPFNLKNRNA